MTYKVGSIVESICGKCNDVMGHAIVAMVGDTIAKVECRMCGSAHRYRPPSQVTSGNAVTLKKGRAGSPIISHATNHGPAARPTAPKKSTRKPDAASLAREQWLVMSHGRQNEPTRSYAINEAFAPKDLINHPVFGLGEVRGIIPPDKMDVLFAEGLKRLLHNK